MRSKRSLVAQRGSPIKANPGVLKLDMSGAATFTSREMHAAVPAEAFFRLNDRDWAPSSCRLELVQMHRSPCRETP
jgi:hypothetical protein